MIDSWKTTLTAVIPLLAGLVLIIIGATKDPSDWTMIVTGLGLLGGGGVGVLAADKQKSKGA